MKGSLDGPNAKLQRAIADMEALRISIEASYPRNRRWPVKTEVFRSGQEYHFSIDSQSPAPCQSRLGTPSRRSHVQPPVVA